MTTESHLAITGRELRAVSALGLQRIAIWATACAAATWLILVRADATWQDGARVPFANDAFYHAHRILAVAAGEPLAQFDPAVQVPGGSWITWPWAYDWVLGQWLMLAQWLAPSVAPMSMLAIVPLLGLGMSLALLVLSGRRLALDPSATLLAAFTFALAPQVVQNHMLGAIDHHWAEALFTLAALASALRWQATGRTRDAVLHAVVLAGAQGVQNGLFVLQAFSLAGLALAWLRGTLPPTRTLAAFAATLLGGTVLLLLPSQPFLRGFDEFWFLGWFHLLAASSSALFTLMLARSPRTPVGSAGPTLVALTVLALVATQAMKAAAFVTADSSALASIHETASALRLMREQGLLAYLTQSSLLPLLAPLALLPLARAAWNDSALRMLLAYAAAGCFLQLLQTRFWSLGFGLAALSMAWLLQAALRRAGESGGIQWVAAALAAAAVLAPAARDLGKAYPAAGSQWFRPLQPVFAPLREACREAPHVVLANPNAGHLLTYFTRCRVVANNFIMTAHDYETRAQAQRLLSLPLDRLRDSAKGIDYVIVMTRRQAVPPDPPGLEMILESMAEPGPQPGYVQLYRVQHTSD